MLATQPLLECQAWSILVLTFKRPRGLCAAIAHLHYTNIIIAANTRDKMQERVSERPVIDSGPDVGFCWPTLAYRLDDARAEFCAAQRRLAIINLTMHERVNNLPHLTEGQAWNVLRLVFSRPLGLCRAIGWLTDAQYISTNTADKMRERFAALPRDIHNYCWPTTPPADYERERMLFCEAQATQLGALGTVSGE